MPDVLQVVYIYSDQTLRHKLPAIHSKDAQSCLCDHSVWQVGFREPSIKFDRYVAGVGSYRY